LKYEIATTNPDITKNTSTPIHPNLKKEKKPSLGNVFQADISIT
jgi:hypothetical protein